MSLSFSVQSSDQNGIEEGAVFAPRFNSFGLITAIVTDAEDGMLLMVAHMNEQALSLTIETGIAHYWSRSRKTLWKKGETSGNLQSVVEMRTDCDQDALWLKVKVAGDGPTCHTGRKSCFYRQIELKHEKVVLVKDAEPDSVHQHT